METKDQDLLTGHTIEMDETSKMNWRKSAIWAKALAIITTIFTGLFLIGFLIIFLFENNYRNDTAAMAITLTIILALMAMFLVFLFRFANGVTNGIRNADQESFTRALTGLRNYFIAGGVIGFIILFFQLISLMS